VKSLVVRAGVLIPPQAMAVQVARSGGPGGQNVNKVSSKVELRVDPSLVVGLDADALARLRSQASGRLDADGRLRVVSQRTRDQRTNLEDCRAKVRELVLAAMRPMKRRRPTGPSRASVERRLADKRRRGIRKAERHEADG
jgi:ribosome-associated protein